MGYGNGIQTLSKVDHDNPEKYWEKFHHTLKNYQNLGRFTDVDLYCDGGAVISLHLSLLHQLSPTVAKISDELNAICCCKCWGSGTSARSCNGATTNNPNRPPLSISLPEVKKHHASLMMQLLYTGRVNLDGGEEDRQGLLDLLETLDIKINPASLSKELIKGRKGKKSLSTTPETSATTSEETPTTAGAQSRRSRDQSSGSASGSARASRSTSRGGASSATAVSVGEDGEVDSAGRKPCPKCGKRYNVSLWFERHYRDCKGTDTEDKDATSPSGILIKKTITCEGCRMSYTYNTTEEDAETVRKCRDCRRKSFRQVLESKTPVGTPSGTPASSPEKQPPTTPAKSPNKRAANKKGLDHAQCFKCQAWFQDDGAFLIHVGECDDKVKETHEKEPDKEPEKEKKTEVTPSPATNQLECEKCGKVYHTRHAYHFRNRLLVCCGTMGQEEQKKNAVETVATPPVTPSSAAAGNTPSTSARSYASSDLAGTCANCGRQYLKRNTHHYQSHILKCGKDDTEPPKVMSKSISFGALPRPEPKDTTFTPPAKVVPTAKVIPPPPAKVIPTAKFDSPKTPVADVAPVNKSSDSTTPSMPIPGLLGPKNYSCEPCGKYYDNSHIWHYHNHMDKKHGIPNPMANQIPKRQREAMARVAREAALPRPGPSAKRKSISFGALPRPEPKRAKTTDDIPFAAEYRPAPPSPSARSELPDRSRQPSSTPQRSLSHKLLPSTSADSADDDIPQMTIVPRRRECKKPARYSDFETDDEQHTRITSPTRAVEYRESASVAEDSGNVVLPAPPMVTKTCFVCDGNFSEKNFAWHVSTHFQVQIKEKYLPDGSMQCPLCDYSANINKLIIKHVAVTHQKLKDFIPEEEATNIFHRMKPEASTKTKPKSEEHFFHEEPFPAAEFKKRKLSAPMASGLSNMEGIFNKGKTARKSFPSTAVGELTMVYECHICNVGFTYASPYKGHLVQHYRDQLRMRVEDCSKDGRTCPECNYVSHTTSDLMYHVARVHDYVLDYLPPHVKEKVVGLDSRNKSGGSGAGGGGGGAATEGGKKTKIVAGKKEKTAAAAAALEAAKNRSSSEFNGDGGGSRAKRQPFDEDGDIECGRCHAVFETMYDLSSHMTRTNCEKKNQTWAKNDKADKDKRGEDFDATVDSVSELIHTCEDCGECFEGDADEHKKACGGGGAAAAEGKQQKEGEEPDAATADGGDAGGNGGSSPEIGGQRTRHGSGNSIHLVKKGNSWAAV